MAGGGWYLAKKGFGRKWRGLVVEELHKHGVEASVRRLTLDPFRGLIAQDVRIYDYKDRENTIAEISRISLDVNYAALLQRQAFLNAIDIRNAQVTLPLPEGADPKSPHAQIKNLHAHIYFPPEQIYVSQADGIFCDIRISATGQLIKRDNYKPSKERNTGRMADATGHLTAIGKRAEPDQILRASAFADQIQRRCCAARECASGGNIADRAMAARQLSGTEPDHNR